MDETLKVWWCEEHSKTGFDKCCNSAKEIGFVTIVKPEEPEVG